MRVILLQILTFLFFGHYGKAQDSLYFPFRVGERVQLRDTSLLQKKGVNRSLVRAETLESPKLSSRKSSNLATSGSLARGFSVGTNQSGVLQSTFNLQIRGNLSPNVSLVGNITDNTSPLQPSGYTQTVQDFDRIFLQIKGKQEDIILGDQDLVRPDVHFLNYSRNIRGISGGITRIFNEGGSVRNRLTFSTARGRFARNQFAGREGNQGPYRLTGNLNEAFIVVLANSERVYLNGELLKRGEQYDYTLDYNTADLRFTPNRIIGNQSRIIVEFEYANQAYVRSLFTYSGEISLNKWHIKAEHIVESDLSSQPIQMELDSSRTAFLSQQRSGFNSGYFPGERKIAYDASQILYKRIDSLGFSPVWVASLNPDSAQYSVQFTFVGQGKGDYIVSANLANGRVFQWVKPQIQDKDTIKQGNYAPLINLIAPQRFQVSTVQFRYKAVDASSFQVEIARSITDSNRLAEPSIGKEAYALFIAGEKKLKLNSQYSLIPFAQFDWIQKDFAVFQPFRKAEFAREWLLPSIHTFQEERLFQSGFRVLTKDSNRLEYRIARLEIAKNYEGTRHSLEGKWQVKHWELNTYNDLTGFLTDTIQSQYLRSNTRSIWDNGRLRSTLKIEIEQNKSEGAILSRGSFAFQNLETSIGTSDSSRQRITFHYQIRNDARARKSYLESIQEAQTMGLSMQTQLNPRTQFRLSTQVRLLSVWANDTTTGGKEQHLIGQAEFNSRSNSGFWQYSGFFNLGNGQEIRRDFSYIEVPTGQGTHIWIDYNQNNIKELNEFELAYFSDRANYIKVLIPSNGFIQTQSSKLQSTLTLSPERILKKERWLGKTLAKLSFQTAFSLDQSRLANSMWIMSDLLNPEASSNTLSANKTGRNTLFWQRNHPSFGLELSRISLYQASLSTNGQEVKNTLEWQGRGRKTFAEIWLFEFQITQRNKTLLTAFAPNRRYDLDRWELESKLNVRLSSSFRLAISANISDTRNLYTKENTPSEKSKTEKYTFEAQYNQLEKSTFKLSLNWIQINFSGNAFSATAYEMLQGFQNGSNQTANLNWNRKIGDNLQMTLQYEVRKMEDSPIIHTGRMQMRLIF